MTVYADSFDVLEFYPYPSYVQNILTEYNEWDRCGEKSVKRFFESVLNTTNIAVGHNLMDNKIAMKIRHRSTGTILYTGYKDNRYIIGLSLMTESANNKIHIMD